MLDQMHGVVIRSELDYKLGAIDRLLENAGVVLILARALGRRCAYLPGYAEKRARDMMPGIAKTDAIDAEVIARTAMGMPQALGPIAAENAAARSLRALSSQRERAVASRTRAKNRLRAVLLEADPEPERAVDPSSPWQMAVLAELIGGARARRQRGPGSSGRRSTRRRGPGGAPARERTSRCACWRARYPRWTPTSPSSMGS